jgi:exopolyphosphatase/guanosine-5'-triphosphate,3'-diphosphate pyrophosphatase
MARPERTPLTIAALDLGSNSFHMIIGRVADQELTIVDRAREQVSLAAGLDDRNRLSSGAQERALACLEMFGQRLRGLPATRVRVVGTNTLRRARNADSFRRKAERVLGHAIEILSGVEEARLIYLGALHNRFSPARQLVADIGGGSTELILGEGFRVLRSASMYMGCVHYSRRFFPDGVLCKKFFREAEIAAALELEPSQKRMRDMSWEVSVGTSGTIRAVHEILRLNGWAEVITKAGVKELRRAMIEAGSVDRLRLPGLKPERAQVLPGGLAILRSILRSLDVAPMDVSTGALREGVLQDLLRRIRHEDVRDRTIGRMMDRYNVDMSQAARVEGTCRQLLQQLDGAAGGSAASWKLLSWASRLHEVGLAVSHTAYHKHGAYLVAHSDMPGFSSDDQATMAALIRAHRRKIAAEMFEEVPAGRYEEITRLAVVFRLAVLLNRGRVSQPTPEFRVGGDWGSVELAFPDGWAECNPLTAADLQREARYLETLGTELRVDEQPCRQRPDTPEV